MSSGFRVIDYVQAYYYNNPKRPPLNEREQRVASVMLEMMNALDEGEVELITEEYLNRFDDDEKDLDWSPEDEECRKIEVCPDVVKVPGQPNMVQFSRGELVDIEKVEKAVEYFGSKKGTMNNGQKCRPSLATMNRLFTFIKEAHHLKKLRQYETNGFVRANRKKNLEFLSNELEKEVRECIENGKILHDKSLRFLIVCIIKRHKLDLKEFKASENWLNGWKRSHGISSRKITKWVATTRHKSREQIEKTSKEFVASANKLFKKYRPSNIMNADQSGFQLEMHSARTLTFTGVKDVPCTVQSASSISHSYTVMPVVAADGTMYKKLFVVLKETNGKFPNKGHYDAFNLVVAANTSHIMNKILMKQFFEEVIFDPSMPKNTLLLLDSWTSWKDQAAIDSVTPPSNKIKVLIIPPGCTGLVQPCDVGIFGGFKKVVKMITGHAQLTCDEHKMYQRDNIIKMLSMVWWQLQSPVLKDWVRYSWVPPGYAVSRPPHFKTPAQALFPNDVASDCASVGCSETSFITCLYCEQLFCITHFLIEYHYDSCSKK